MTSTLKLTLISAAIYMLTACATTKPALATHSVAFGNAVHQNTVAQHVAPTPEQKSDTYIPASNARRALARKNYDENKVMDPVPLRTTN